ncbi:tetratricopeptide repeat protein [Asanoa sp. NPDC049518]|uniref:ATP-binding protein n=1 Tax=unclassified Asanoa TaxID=2685164 RepID=UPI00341C9780
MDDGFATQLRSYRLRGQLTQEALAERAGISSRSIGEMERGRGRGPRPRTVEWLATALDLSGEEREAFVDAGRSLFWGNRSGSAVAPRGAAEPIRHLPPDLADFVGRDKELGLLDAILHPRATPARVAAISGPPGVGKSALAIHASHRLASRFPDGQLYAVLGGQDRAPAEPADVLALLLRMLGVDGSALPAGVDARAALFRTRIAGRRMLLVLDNAAGHRQVEALMPPDGVAVVVTSRLSLTGLAGVTTIDLRPLPTTSSIDLLCQVAGAERVLAEPDAAATLVAACDNLPLAVRVVAARLAARPQWTVRMIGERLTDERRRLDEMRHGDLAVRLTLQVTYQALSRPAARAFALLGALSSLGVRAMPEWAVPALLGAPSAAASVAVEELLDARLIEPVGPDGLGLRRYRFHEITRLYARECRENEISEAEWSTAFARVAHTWLGLARRARPALECERFHLDDPAVVVPDPDPVVAAAVAARPVEWFETEREALTALVSACADAGLVGPARGLAACAAEFYELRGYYDDWRRVMETALAACRAAGDPVAEAAVLRGLGTCLVESDDLEGAQTTLGAARDLAERVGDSAGAAMARKDLGYVLGLTGQLDAAEEQLRSAVENLARTDRDPVTVIAMANLAFVLRQRGAVDEAVTTLQTALLTARRSGDRFALAYASRGLASALLAAGRVDRAGRAARQAARLFRDMNDLAGAAQSLRTLGEALDRDPARALEAEEAFAEAAEIFRGRGHTWGLALTELSLGETRARRQDPRAQALLRSSLRFWTDENVPALRARALVALATVAEQAGDPSAVLLLTEAYELYRGVGAPEAQALVRRLGWDEDHEIADLPA